MIPTPRKILVIRNDKLGDFMLAWPSFALLRSALPDTEIHALVPDYTRPLAELCAYLDAIATDPGRGSGWSGFRQLTEALRDERYDAVITLFSTGRIGAAVRMANIPYRLAPATKIAQLFYNHRLLQRRSRSEQPEWLYNTDLVRRFLRDWNIDCPPLPSPPYLRFDHRNTDTLRKRFHAEHRIPPRDRLVFVHPGSGGSASNLRPEQFAILAHSLRSEIPLTFVVTAGPSEQSLAEQLVASLKSKNLSARLYVSEQGLVAFARHLQLAHLFISGSTGPLHVAGAMNLRTVGFYPSKRSSTPLRWQTLSDSSRRIAFSPVESNQDANSLNIDIESAADSINQRFFSPEHSRAE